MFQNKIEFTDEIESVKAEAEKLAADGVEVLIALGHSGYEIDIVSESICLFNYFNTMNLQECPLADSQLGH